MSEKNNFQTTVESLFKGVDSLISSKTVVGEAVQIGDITILPLIDVSFGMGAGSNLADKKDKGSGGVGGKLGVSAVLVIKDGNARLISVKNQDTISKILDMVPEIVDKFTTKKEDKMTEEDVVEILNSAE